MSDCGHFLCRDCYSDYLSSQLTQGPDCIYTICPCAPCKLIVPNALFKEALSPVNYERFNYYYTKSFVDINKRAKWCPGKGCKVAFEYPSMKQCDIVCEECGTDWCFKCLRKAHRPIACD